MRGRFYRRHGWLVEGVAFALLVVIAVRVLPLRGLVDSLLAARSSAPVAAASLSDIASLGRAHRLAEADLRTESGDTRQDPTVSNHTAPPAFVLEQHRVSIEHLPALGYPGFVPSSVVETSVKPAGPFCIDCGTDDGVRVGDPVLFADALVGLVEDAGARSSEVRPISDPGFRFASTLHAEAARHREAVPRFAVTGSEAYPGWLEVRIHPDWGRLGEGVAVVTARDPRDSVPTGLRLGTVRERYDRSERMIRRCDVAPAATPRALIRVVVLASEMPREDTPGSPYVAAGRASFERFRDRPYRDDGLERRWLRVSARLGTIGDLSPHRRSATLDRGRRDGVVSGACVVKDGCLLGIVEHVTARSSRFRRLGDPGLLVPAFVPGARSLGRPHSIESVGFAGGQALLRIVPASSDRVTASDLADGDEVVTRGRTPAIPAGLRVDLSDPALALDGAGARSVIGRPFLFGGARVEIWVPRDEREERP